MPAAEKWLEEKWPEIREEYDPEDIWNGDETGLFYRALPKGWRHFVDNDISWTGSVTKNV